MIIFLAFLSVVLFCGFSNRVIAGEEHEYKTIQWIQTDSLEIGGLHFLDQRDSIVSLHEIVGKPIPEVLIVSFMAEWCKNCRYEAPHLEKIYKKYQPEGLNVLVVMEYSDPLKSQAFINKFGLSMSIVTGDLTSKDESQRSGTQHHRLRSAINDPRAWGTPLHIIIEKGNFSKLGFVPGEFRPEELENYLEQALNR